MNPALTLRGHESYAQASINLSRFVTAQAIAAERLVGFSWKPSANAPSQFSALKRAYLASTWTGQRLLVSDEHCEETIYISALENYAFRFWHDVTHVRMDQGFDLDGEIIVARSHLAVLTAAGWGEGSPEYELFRAETLGRALCFNASGQFPNNQPCFARRAVTSSLGRAIRAERQPDTSDPEMPVNLNGASDGVPRSGSR